MKSLTALLSTMASVAAILFLVSTVWAEPPAAKDVQQICAPRDAAVAELVGEFEEHVIGRGLSHNGQAMIELFRSETGSWTVMATDVNGVSCVIANGQVWLQAQNQTNGYVYVNTKN